MQHLSTVCGGREQVTRGSLILTPTDDPFYVSIFGQVFTMFYNIYLSGEVFTKYYLTDSNVLSDAHTEMYRNENSRYALPLLKS